MVIRAGIERFQPFQFREERQKEAGFAKDLEPNTPAGSKKDTIDSILIRSRRLEGSSLSLTGSLQTIVGPAESRRV